MPGVHDLWLFILTGLLLNATPGPDIAYIVGRSAQMGVKAGVSAALGIGTGALVHNGRRCWHIGHPDDLGGRVHSAQVGRGGLSRVYRRQNC